jgi:import inner membrane translocase subunit TIM16
MVKRLLIKLIYEFGTKGINSILKAYRETVKSRPTGDGNHNKKEEKKKESDSSFGGFSFNNLISNPMTKEEALKILNLKETDLKPEEIMSQFEKYFEANDPTKGGSFYIQNKIYYAKEFLMDKFPKDLNKSQYNPGSNYKPSEEKTKEDPLDKNINDKI